MFKAKPEVVYVRGEWLRGIVGGGGIIRFQSSDYGFTDVPVRKEDFSTVGNVGNNYLVPHDAPMRALENLTCGGSEYVGDVEACVKYIRARLETHYDMMVKKHLQLKASQDALRRCQEALKKCVGVFQTLADKGNYPEPLISTSPVAADGGWSFALAAIEAAEKELK